MHVASSVMVVLSVPPASDGAAAKQVIVPGMPETAQSAPTTTGVPSGAPATGKGAAPAAPGMQLWLIIGVMFTVMILMSVFSGRKEKRRRAEMLSGLKRHARVQTIGGVIGSITEVNDDDIVLRVEEGRIRVAKSAVSTILRDAAKQDETTTPEIKPARERVGV